MFNRTLGGVILQGPTDWFYGDSLRVDDEPDVKFSKLVPQAKSLDIIGISMIHMLLKHGRDFVKAVNCLQAGARISSEAGRRLAKSEKDMGRNYQRMLTQLEQTWVKNKKRDIQNDSLLEPMWIEHGLVQMRHRVCRLDAARAD